MKLRLVIGQVPVTLVGDLHYSASFSLQIPRLGFTTARKFKLLTAAFPATESGIDTSVTRKFPGSTAEYGSHVSGAGDNRDIPVEEGGDIQKGTGRLTKARDFDQGEAGEGPEDILKKREDENPGSDEFGRSAGELKDETSGTPGGGDGAGAPVSSGGPGYTDDSTGAAGGRVP